MSDWNIGHSASWYEPEYEEPIGYRPVFIVNYEGEELERFRTEEEAKEYIKSSENPDDDWEMEEDEEPVWRDEDGGYWDARDWDD